MTVLFRHNRISALGPNITYRWLAPESVLCIVAQYKPHLVQFKYVYY